MKIAVSTLAATYELLSPTPPSLVYNLSGDEINTNHALPHTLWNTQRLVSTKTIPIRVRCPSKVIVHPKRCPFKANVHETGLRLNPLNTISNTGHLALTTNLIPLRPLIHSILFLLTFSAKANQPLLIVFCPSQTCLLPSSPSTKSQ